MTPFRHSPSPRVPGPPSELSSDRSMFMKIVSSSRTSYLIAWTTPSHPLAGALTQMTPPTSLSRPVPSPPDPHRPPPRRFPDSSPPVPTLCPSTHCCYALASRYRRPRTSGVGGVGFRDLPVVADGRTNWCFQKYWCTTISFLRAEPPHECMCCDSDGGSIPGSSPLAPPPPPQAPLSDPPSHSDGSAAVARCAPPRLRGRRLPRSAFFLGCLQSFIAARIQCLLSNRTPFTLFFA